MACDMVFLLAGALPITLGALRSVWKRDCLPPLKSGPQPEILGGAAQREDSPAGRFAPTGKRGEDPRTKKLRGLPSGGPRRSARRRDSADFDRGG